MGARAGVHVRTARLRVHAVMHMCARVCVELALRKRVRACLRVCVCVQVVVHIDQCKIMGAHMRVRTFLCESCTWG